MRSVAKDKPVFAIVKYCVFLLCNTLQLSTHNFDFVSSGSRRSQHARQRHLFLSQLEPIPAFDRIQAHIKIKSCRKVQEVRFRSLNVAWQSVLKPARPYRALQLDNEARTRQDYSHYRVMMRALRRSEENYHDNSKISYLIQVCE